MKNKIYKMGMLALLLVLCSPLRLSAQVQLVSGYVRDSGGEALAGVMVVEKDDYSHGTTTDAEGFFSIKVDAKATLVVSLLGYRGQELALAGRTRVELVLEEERTEIEEVVVVGYGTMKKVNLTGAVATVDYAENMNRMPVMATASSLAGMVSGLSIQQRSGQPGSENMLIRLRGYSTFNNDGGNNTLVIVDGQEIDAGMSGINPADIESISVLKDAASTAIYGVRGANGVILITTKSGSSKPQVSYSFSGVFQQPYNDLAFVSDYADYMELLNEARANINQSAIFSPGSIALWREASKSPNEVTESGLPNYMVYPNTEWFDTIFHNGFSQQHNLSFSHATDRSNVRIALGYLVNDGIMTQMNMDSSYKRLDVSVNAETKLFRWLTIGTRLRAQRSQTGMANISNGFNYLYQTTPGIYPGSPNAWGIPALTAEESSNANNILGQMAGGAGHNRNYRLYSDLYFKLEPIKSLFLEGTVRYAPQYTDKESYSRPNGKWNYVTNVRYSSSKLENATNTTSTSSNYTLESEILLRYNRTIAEKHELGAILGFNANHYEKKGFSVQRKGASDWSIHDLGTYSELVSSSNTALTQRRRASFFGRANYAYSGRYLFEFNFRADGSSRFGKNRRWGYFPAVSAGWVISKERFMENVDFVSLLKLRASYGITGNDAVGDYASQSVYSIKNVVVNDEIGQGYRLTDLSNTELGWEQTGALDIGIDYGFFDNRLTGELDWYNRRTTGVLCSPTIYLTTGWMSAPKVNVGEYRNYGLEFSINWRDRIGRDFTYEIGANFSWTDNRVVKFLGQHEAGWTYDDAGNRVSYMNNLSNVCTSFGGGYLCEGHRLAETYMYRLYKGSGTGYRGGEVDVNAGPKDGMIRTESDMEWVKAMLAAGYKFSGNTSTKPNQFYYGDFLYADLNGDGNYGDANDVEWTGHSEQPKYNIGLNFSCAWKGFDFSMQWAGSLGFHLVWSTSYYNTTLVSSGYGIMKHIADDHYFYDPSDPANPRNNIDGKYPRLTFGTTYNNTQKSEFYEYKGDYLKLKNIQLGYRIPERITQKFHVSVLRAYVSLQNILTITAYPGLDPEIGTSIGYPLMRQISIGAQITF